MPSHLKCHWKLPAYPALTRGLRSVSVDHSWLRSNVGGRGPQGTADDHGGGEVATLGTLEARMQSELPN